MTGFRFLHASDLHLGKAFARYPEPARGRLVDARHGAIARLTDAARARDIGHVLLAGDTFDSETPSERVVRQALDAFAAADGLVWWLLPGNHDSLAAEALWDRLRGALPGNVRLADRPAPAALAPGVALLPAPVPRRQPGRDPTAWMDAAATPADTRRLGLAHGPVVDFSTAAEAPGTIAPDRPRRAGLAYLALGDWHGALTVGPAAAYSGAPERDGFRHAGRGTCLAVTLRGEGAAPEIETVRTGVFDWAEIALTLTPGDAAAALVTTALEGGAARRDRLRRLTLGGRVGMAARRAMAAAVDKAAPAFCHLESDWQDLSTDRAPEDLDAIAAAGALRAAAEALAAEADDDPDGETRAVAAAALNRLYGMVAAEGADAAAAGEG
ncbi:MAG: metallophosphoesterase [Pseudomonadota bacterium]